jgi:hypothetical protein
MLDALALAALFAHWTKNPVSDLQALHLKFRLIVALSIGDNHCKDGEEGRDPRLCVDGVRDRLCKFAETCVGRPGHLAHLFDPDVDWNLNAAMPHAWEAMLRHFDEQEHSCLAQLIVRDVDRRLFEMH